MWCLVSTRTGAPPSPGPEEMEVWPSWGRLSLTSTGEERTTEQNREKMVKSFRVCKFSDNFHIKFIVILSIKTHFHLKSKWVKTRFVQLYFAQVYLFIKLQISEGLSATFLRSCAFKLTLEVIRNQCSITSVNRTPGVPCDIELYKDFLFNE